MDKKFTDTAASELLNLSPDLFCVLSREGLFVNTNQAFETYLGYPAEEIYGKSFVSFLHPDDRESSLKQFESMPTDGNTTNFVNRFRAKDNSFIWLEWRTGIGSQGQVLGIARDISNSVGVELDITERNNTIHALRKSEEKFRKIFENMQDVYLQTDQNGIISEISPSIKRCLQYEREELIGTLVENLYFNREQRTELLRELNEKGELLDFELMVRNKAGEAVWVSVNNHRMENSNREFTGIETLVRNIHERKIAETKLRNLSIAVEQSPVSIVISDPAGNIEYVNPKAAETTGYTMEELKGKNPRVLKSGVTSSEEYRDLWETISSGRQWSGTFHNKRKNGTLYWESSSISPIVDPSGNITNYVAIKEDITEKKRANDELIANEAMLKKANTTKDKLFSIIAHDLRGPIGSFEPILELLTSDENLDERERTLLLKGLLKGSRTVFGLLENLLSWAKSQSNGMELYPEDHIINEIVKENVDLLTPIAGQKSIGIAMVDNGPVSVFIDRDSINLVVRNLLYNAIKFSNEYGKITITLRDNETYAEVEVEDNGIGIEKKIADNLFNSNAFYTTLGTGNEKGSGLGLVLCKDFVEKNGGTIRVESIQGAGSKFIFTVPKYTLAK